jgi:hemoglobin-like flavoprotein
MTLTVNQRLLVQNTFKQISAEQGRTTQLFYDRLFTVYPETRSLFKNNTSDQGFKFIQMLSMIINGLERQERFTPIINQNAQKHLAFGVQRGDYPKAGDALLWAIEQVLGDGFTPEVQEAWQAAYILITQISSESAYE